MPLFKHGIYNLRRFSEFLRAKERGLSSHAETENMERGRVVNRHVAPRTNTVSSFREVSEGAGNAGLHRTPWTCTYALAGLQGQIVAEIGDDPRSKRTKVDLSKRRKKNHSLDENGFSSSFISVTYFSRFQVRLD